MKKLILLLTAALMWTALQAQTYNRSDFTFKVTKVKRSIVSEPSLLSMVYI